jgi:hypothetical protein
MSPANVASLVIFALTFQAVPPPQSGAKEAPVAEDAKVTLRLVGNPGDVYTYAYESGIRLVSGDGELILTGTQTEKFIRQVEAETEWEVRTVFRKIEAGGKLQPLQGVFRALNGVPLSVHMDSRGRTIRQGIDGEYETPQASEEVIFPEGAIGVGDTWNAPFKVAGERVPMTYRLDEIRTIQGRRTAILSGRVLNDPKVKLVKPMVAWIDVSHGRLLFLEFGADAQTRIGHIQVGMKVTLTASSGG